MTQTQWVIQQLRSLNPELEFEIVPFVTKGDRIQDVALSKVGGKGLFVSELEAALQDGRADIAVHSLKDVPAKLADGLTLGAFPVREDPRDAFVSASGASMSDLRAGAVVGTSSLRRSAQLRRLRSDIQIVPLRGNVDTRLRRVSDGDLDAVVLAAAGLHRLGLAERISGYLSVDDCLPAIGQGILALECREDAKLLPLLQRLTDERTARAAAAERTLMRRLNGSCQVPLAGYAKLKEDGRIWLRGYLADENGAKHWQAESIGTDAEAVGHAVAERLLSQGAGTTQQAVAEDK